MLGCDRNSPYVASRRQWLCPSGRHLPFAEQFDSLGPFVAGSRLAGAEASLICWCLDLLCARWVAVIRTLAPRWTAENADITKWWPRSDRDRSFFLFSHPVFWSSRGGVTIGLEEACQHAT